MGLCFVKAIADSLNGTVSLEHSEIGQGSTFLFRFPTRIAKLKRKSPITNTKCGCISEDITISTTHIPDVSVLIVDDQPFIKKMISYRFSQIIEGENPSIRFAETGEQAIDIVKNNHIDVIVMDENMESCGGILKGSSALDLIRHNNFNGVCILCSGDDGLQCSAADFVWTKPLPSEAIMCEAINQCLKSRS